MTPILTGIVASGISGHLTPPWSGPEGGYDALASVTISGSTAGITFSGIPQGYKHLEIRGTSQAYFTGGTQYGYLGIRYNNDTGNNYSFHLIRSNGGDVSVSGAVNNSYAYAGHTWLGTSAGSKGGSTIISILDYASTSKAKVSRSVGFVDNNSSSPPGVVGYHSGAWHSTAAVNSVTVYAVDGNFLSGSFALYGVK